MAPLCEIAGPSRLLFASYHCYLDPASGAALATRDLLELLSKGGWVCRAFCGPHVDAWGSKAFEQILADHEIHFGVRQGTLEGIRVSLFQFDQRDVPVTIFDAPAARSDPIPSAAEGAAFVSLFDRAVEEFQPHVLLTYGGQWMAHEMMARARRRGVAVVFALHNLEYRGWELLRAADAILVPSRFTGEYYRQAMGLEYTAIPNVLDWDRVQCSEIRGKYITFVNPQPAKGLFVFARIVEELAARRPDIPFLVVEGRGKAGCLQLAELDLARHSTLHFMENTPDPRDFYQVSRLVLVPSLVPETFTRVAAEALINGIPVLASNRGNLRETLGEAGFLFDVPERYTPESTLVPTAGEVAPWIETILRLWDDDALYDVERRRCLRAAEIWRPERLAPRCDEFFSAVARLPKLAPQSA